MNHRASELGHNGIKTLMELSGPEFVERTQVGRKKIGKDDRDRRKT